MNRKNVFHIFSILAAWIFLAVPFLLVWGDWVSARERELAKLAEISDQNSKILLEQIQVSGNWDFQVLRTLNNFQRELRTELTGVNKANVKAKIEELYREKVLPGLPPHHISIALNEKLGKGLKVAFENSDLEGENLLGCFASLLDRESPSTGVARKASDKLFKMTGFPVDASVIANLQGEIKGKDEGLILPFTSKISSKWLYWFYPNEGETRVLISAVFDAEKIPADYTYKALTQGIDVRDTGLVFFPLSEKSKPIWSSFFCDKPGLRKYLHGKAKNFPLALSEHRFFDCKIYTAPVLVGPPAILVLVKKEAEKVPLFPKEALFITLTSFAFCILSLILLQRKIFNRGPRISIGMVLLTAIISIFYLPAGIGHQVVQYSIDGHLSAIKKSAEIDLEKNLQRLEDRFNLSMADFFYRIHHLENYPEILTEIRNGKVDNALGNISTSVKAMYPKKLPNSFMFLSMQNDMGKNSVMIEKDHNNELGEMFLPMVNGLFKRFRPDLPGKVGVEASNLSLKEVKAEITTDFLVKFFQGILGTELFNNLMANPADLIEPRSTFVTASTSIVPIKLDGVLKAMMLAIWGEYDEEEKFLNFLIDNRSELPENFDFVACRKGSFDRWERKSLEKIPPQVWDLTDRTRRVGVQLTSRELLNSDKLLIKSKPGKSLGLYILSGVTSLKEVFDEQMKLEEGFNAFLISGFAVLLALVIFLYRYFMNPLNRLKTCLESVQKGDFHARFATDSKKDEFGRIGNSFNALAKGLEEGSLLGKFVSSAVINVVKDKAAFSRALVGEKREMTILFASMKIDHETGVEEIFKKLEFNLKSCQEAVRNTSGIIDKVMEEKMLIFFDHDACGSAVEAVKQSMGVVFSMKENLESKGYSGYFGLATGSVVAGILGAKNIRLDYTVIGDAVNLSARLNALAKDDSGSQIIMDEPTRWLIPENISVDNLGGIQIKGKVDSVQIFRCFQNM